MNRSTIVKIAGGLGFLLLCWFAYDRFHQLDLVHSLTADRETCAKAAQDPQALVEKCPPAVALRIVQARRADQCEAGIKQGDLYLVRATCGEAVKRQGADLAAAAADLQDARLQLAQAGKLTAEAVARAEARATTQADRKAKDDQTIQSAPRGSDGSVHCDADCLRRLSGPQADRPGT